MSGETLRSLLLENKYVLSDVAKKCNTSQQAFNNILNAKDVKSGTLEKLCRVLNVDMWFFYPDGLPRQCKELVNNNVPYARARNMHNGRGDINDNSTGAQSNDNVILELLKQNSELLAQQKKLTEHIIELGK